MVTILDVTLEICVSNQQEYCRWALLIAGCSIARWLGETPNTATVNGWPHPALPQTK